MLRNKCRSCKSIKDTGTKIQLPETIKVMYTQKESQGVKKIHRKPLQGTATKRSITQRLCYLT